MAVKNKKRKSLIKKQDNIKKDIRKGDIKDKNCYHCDRKICLLTILILVSLLSGALWLYYFKVEISIPSFHGIYNVFSKQHIHPVKEGIKKPNINSGSMDSYNIASLAYKIKKQIDEGQDYDVNLNGLKKLVTEDKKDALLFLEENKDKILTSDKEIITALNNYIEMLNQKIKIEDKENKGFVDKIKDSIGGMFKVKKIEDTSADKASQTNINIVITKIVENNYKEAVRYIELIPGHPSSLQEIEVVLNAKAKAKSILKTMLENTLNNG